MNLFSRIFSKPEKRSAPTSWDNLRSNAVDTDAGVPVSAYAAENISTVYAAVQCISEITASLAVHVYKKLASGRAEAPDHPVARIFSGDANDWQAAFDFVEMQTAITLLRGNSYAVIIRDGRGAPVQLVPYHPDLVSVVRIPRSNRYAYDISFPEGGTRRFLPEEVFHLRDRSDDGVLGKSRLQRARETFGVAIATERYAGTTFKNGASMSGVLSHPEALDDASAERLRKSFEQTYSGSGNAGRVAVLEEGLKWQQVSVSPDDAQMLQSRRFTVEQIARIFRVPPPLLGHMEGSNYSSVSELGRWFIQYSIVPWLRRWETTIERSLLSEEGRRQFEVEFDADELLRGDMLQRFQSYRIAREIGVYSANELRAFEKANRRADAAGDEYFAPANMTQEQTAQPIADRNGGENAAA